MDAPPRSSMFFKKAHLICQIRLSKTATEASFLPRGEALKAVKQRGGSANTASGFGASSKPSKAAKSKQSKRPPSALAKEMQRAGVVRIDGVLSAESVDKLRQFVDEERAIAEAEVAVRAQPCHTERKKLRFQGRASWSSYPYERNR
eukprot:6189394-Pleurochrysis_carterae.AAC.4